MWLALLACVWLSTSCATELTIPAAASLSNAFREFGATLMVAGSIPGRTQTLSVAVFEAVQSGQDATANLLVGITSLTCVAVLLAVGRAASAW